MSEDLPDYYALLHVDPGAPEAVIRASYRTLMQRLGAHPDLGGDHERAAALNAAWATLRDPARRAIYDARRSAGTIDGSPSRGRENARSRAQGHGQARGDSDARSDSDARGDPEARSYGRDDSACAQPRAPADRSESRTLSVRAGTGAPRNAAASGHYGSTADAAKPRVVIAERCPFCLDFVRDMAYRARAAESCGRCGAPLVLVQAVSAASTQSQRAVYRISRAQPLRVYRDADDKVGVSAQVHDISVTGMRFSCQQALSVGTVIRSECEICASVARIAHVGEESAGMWQFGAKFLTVKFNRQRGSFLSVPA